MPSQTHVTLCELQLCVLIKNSKSLLMALSAIIENPYTIKYRVPVLIGELLFIYL